MEFNTKSSKTFWEQYKILILSSTAFLIVIIMITGIAFFVYRLAEKLDNPPPQKLSDTNITLDGKPSKASDPQVIFVQGQNTVTKEIAYIQKEADSVTGEKEKTDVQIERKENKIYVKVNGKLYEVPVEVTENTKFENGKLVVTETSKTDINITGPNPAKWSLSYLRDVKGNQGVGVTYGINKVLKAKVLFVEKRDPMFGIEVSLGDLQSKSPKKQVSEKQTSEKKVPEKQPEPQAPEGSVNIVAIN